MIEQGIIKVREKREPPNEDFLELTLLGDEIQKIGWKKYLEQTGKKKFNWDKFLNKSNLIVTIILSILTAISIVYSLGTGRETEQLKQEVDSLKSEVHKQNSKLTAVDTTSMNHKPDTTTTEQK
jgi:predicted ATPase